MTSQTRSAASAAVGTRSDEGPDRRSSRRRDGARLGGLGSGYRPTRELIAESIAESIAAAVVERGTPSLRDGWTDHDVLAAFRLAREHAAVAESYTDPVTAAAIGLAFANSSSFTDVPSVPDLPTSANLAAAPEPPVTDALPTSGQPLRTRSVHVEVT